MPSEASGELAEEFSLFTLEGNRFNRKGMPVDAMAELVTYRDLLVEVTKVVYRASNPKAHRVPNGLEAAVELRLTTVRSGSAVGVLVRDAVDTQSTVDGPETDPFGDLYSAGRQAIEDILQAVADDEPAPWVIGRRLWAMFANLGRTLGPGESLGLGPPGSKTPRVSLTPVVRTRLRQLADLPAQRGWGSAFGSIVAINSLRRECILDTEARQVTCEYSIQMSGVIRKFLADEETQLPKVVVFGMAELRTNGSPEAFTEIRHVHRAGQQVVQEVIMPKLNVLDQLIAGWDGPNSKPISALAIERYQQFVDALGHRATAELEPIALPSGGIRMEWERYNVSYVAEISPVDGMYLCRLDDDEGDDDLTLAAFDPARLAVFYRDGNLDD